MLKRIYRQTKKKDRPTMLIIYLRLSILGSFAITLWAIL